MVYVTPPGSCSSFVCGTGSSSCPDAFGCSGPADFWIKRHDTKPPFKIKVTECDGTPMDLTGLILEASMWYRAKLKRDLEITDTYFALADNIGFDQCKVGDIIVMDRVRAPEQMLITGFDENLKLIQVQRGYNGSIISQFKKGTVLRVFRVLNAIATTEMDKESITQIDGKTLDNVLTESRLVYEWLAPDTCLPGCFYFEFKLIKMTDDSTMDSLMLTPSTPSFISYTAEEMGCDAGSGVEWVRRFPTDSDGYVIRIFDSPTAENVF
jgi:hypothetical protein